MPLGSYLMIGQYADIMEEAKRTVLNLKPRARRKILTKGPVAEGLEKVPPTVKAYCPREQVHSNFPRKDASV